MSLTKEEASTIEARCNKEPWVQLSDLIFAQAGVRLGEENMRSLFSTHWNETRVLAHRSHFAFSEERKAAQAQAKKERAERRAARKADQ